MEITQEERDKIISWFMEPRVIGICGNKHTGKSNLIYHMIETLTKAGGNFNLYHYGLSYNPGGTEIFSVEELEQITDSVIVLDEINSLLDLETRSKKREIEQFLRLLAHNNCCVLLSSVAENYKKFLSSKVEIFIYKTTTIADAINGSLTKKILQSYSGSERGNYVVKMPPDKALVYDGQHYSKINIPYYKKYDSKANNKPIVSFPSNGSDEIASSGGGKKNKK